MRLPHLAAARLATLPPVESFDDIMERAEHDIGRRLREWRGNEDAGGDLEALRARWAEERAREPPTRPLTPDELAECDVAAKLVNARLDRLAERAGRSEPT